VRVAAQPWWGLLPGAALVGVGIQVMHLVTVFYLAPKIVSSSNLYGSLGAAATLLLAVYLVSRLVLGAAVLNVAVLDVYYVRTAVSRPTSLPGTQ
jgi:uncharacterized BrkB/YihY/UPF0761 family membrane protein